ncbi:MAG TPA: ABC transporter substrate-binding protein [Acidimicrobiales bacterium]
MRARGRFAAGLVAALAASACSSSTTDADRPAGVVRTVPRLTIAVPADRGPMNLFLGTDDRMAELVYDKLLAPSPYVAEPQPWLAEEVVQVDPSTVDARLRTDVTWHDGTPFTPEDVKFTVEYFKASPTGRWTHHVSDVPTIQSVEVVGPATVRFTCAFPCPDLATVTLADLPIIPRHVWEKVAPADAPKHTDLPVGTGPYRLTSYSPTSGYRLEANPDYFMGAPVVTELVMPVIPDVSATFTALRTGEIDAALRAVPPELVDQLGGSGITVVTTKPLQFVEMRVNYQRPPFEVPEVRRAVSLAIDRQDLLDTVVLGQGRPSDKGYPHPDSPWTNPALTTPSDAGEAGRLLDGLGFTDGDGDGTRERPAGERFAVAVKVNGAEPTRVRAAELVAEDLGGVGIAVEITTLDAGGMLALNRSRDFDLAIGEITAHGVADPTQFIMSHRSGYLWQSPQMPYPEWDVLFERWKAAPTVPERRVVSFEMQALFNRQPTSIPLYYPDEYWAFRAGAFDGWVESPGFGIIHKWSFVTRDASLAANAITQEFK